MENETSDLYVKDDLADYANIEAVHGSEHTLPSRGSLLEMALGVEPTTVCSGGYQGTYLFIVVVNDTLWLIKDAYGSCSYCDGLLAQRVRKHKADDEEEKEELQREEDENLQQYARSMMNNAYAFESKNDAVRFLDEKAPDEERNWYHGWESVAEDGITALNEVDY
jgi:hypothetical protein